MGRHDRLNAIVTHLRGTGHATAAALAARHGVSERTIYRDMAVLEASGVPVTGTPGTGYALARGTTLPAMTLSDAEMEALMLALTALGTSALDQAEAAQALAARIEALLPQDDADAAPESQIAPHRFADHPAALRHLPTLRAAVAARQRVQIDWQGRSATLRPLAVEYWGRAWRAIAWSETDARFDTIVLDQITALRPLPGLFVDEPGKRLRDWRAQNP